MLGPLPLAALVWLLHFCHFTDAEAKGNILSHAYERIWLYEMYDYFCDIDGTYGQGDPQNRVPSWQVGLPRQEKIYGCWRSHFKKSGTDNKGSGRDGRLNFAEFQFRLQKGTVPSALVPADLPADDSWKDETKLKNLADNLVKRGWAGIIKFEDNGIDKNRFNGFKAPADDPLKTTYNELMERVEAEYTKSRLDPSKSGMISEDRARRLSILGERIITMRKQDNLAFLADFLKRELPGVIVERVQSDILEHPAYDKINLQRTWNEVYRSGLADNPVILKWSGRDEADEAKRYLFSYVNDNGVGGQGIDFPKEAKVHRRVLTAWEKFLDNHKKTVDKLKECSS